jgi:hypothetical protein
VIAAAPQLRLIRVCREGEAIALAAGLLLGGKRPVVLIQCTGLFEAGDALRNVIHDLKVPLFFIVGVRSYYAHRRATTDTCRCSPSRSCGHARSVSVAEERHTASDLAAAYRQAQVEPGGAVLLTILYGCLPRALCRRRPPRRSHRRHDHDVVGVRRAVRLAAGLPPYPIVNGTGTNAWDWGWHGAAGPRRDRANGDGCTLMNLGCLVTLAGNPADVFW